MEYAGVILEIQDLGMVDLGCLLFSFKIVKRLYAEHDKSVVQREVTIFIPRWA